MHIVYLRLRASTLCMSYSVGLVCQVVCTYLLWVAVEVVVLNRLVGISLSLWVFPVSQYTCSSNLAVVLMVCCRIL